MKYTKEELKNIVENHQHWINEDCADWKNMRANLEGANLEGANLEGANLKDANLEGANLKYANLKGANIEGANLYCANLKDANIEGANLYCANIYGANLYCANLKDANLYCANIEGANLYCANIYGANLYCANLKDANLYCANLKGANLEGANLKDANIEGANLYCANLEGANLYGANIDEKEKFRLGQILKEPMTGYKKTREGIVITATIPAGAIVFCINGSKCRTNKARIIDMGGQNELLHSSYKSDFEYRLMQDIEIEDFNIMYNVECAPGYHFFRTREEAEKYNA